MSTNTLPTLLAKYGITEPGPIYTYRPVSLPWWDDKEATEFEVSYFLSEDGNPAILLYFSPDVDGMFERDMVYASAFTEHGLQEPALVSSAIIKHQGLTDLPFDEEQSAYLVEDRETAIAILEGVLTLVEDPSPAVWHEADTDEEFVPEPGETLAHFLSMMAADTDAANPDAVSAFLQMAVAMEGEEYLAGLRKDISTEQQIDLAAKHLTAEQWAWIKAAIEKDI